MSFVYLKNDPLNKTHPSKAKDLVVEVSKQVVTPRSTLPNRSIRKTGRIRCSKVRRTSRSAVLVSKPSLQIDGGEFKTEIFVVMSSMHGCSVNVKAKFLEERKEQNYDYDPFQNEK